MYPAATRWRSTCGCAVSDKVKAVEVRAELRQIKTMADNSVNVVLSLPEDCMEQVKVLLDWLNLEVRVLIEVKDGTTR